MARSKTKETKPTPKFEKTRRGCRPFLGILFFVLGALILVSLVDFDPQQHERNQVPPAGDNLVGAYGTQIAYWSFYILGGAGWLIPFACAYLSYGFFRFARNLGTLKFIAVLACLLSAAALMAMQGTAFIGGPSDDLSKYPMGPGGIVGSVLYAPPEALQEQGDQSFRGSSGEGRERFPGLMSPRLGVVGSGLVLSGVFALGLLLLATGNIGESLHRLVSRFVEWKTARAARRAERREARQNERQLKLEEKQRRREEKAREREENKKGKKTRLSAREKLERELDGDGLEEIVPVAAPIAATAVPAGSRAATSEKIPAPNLKRNANGKRAATEDPVGAPLARPNPDALPPPGIQGSPREQLKPKIIKSETLRKAPVKLPERQGDYEFPTLDLLAKQEEIPTDDRENHEETARALIHTLATFGVDARVDEIHVGPVITRFDILPAPGTKVSKIQGLENDIAMGLKALAVRILAPVPGKGCVGVEIPNKQPQPVCLREIIESEDWSSSRAEIPIGLGKDVSGKPLVADLTRMPHLLIAGSTGSGKTVCINSIIASLLYHATPEELRFIMVDPKIVEMKVFNDLPHMLIPVVTEPKKVPGALKWLLNEMQRRYELFAAIGVRNIGGFHSFRKKEDAREKAAREAAAAAERNEIDGNLPEAVAPQVTPDFELEIPKTLPYIVCIIDELADLMMVAPAEIETGIARLAQLARAAGIHLILATQRPSVNVITGVIKANLPSRISFKVASKVDSRTILDTGGADALIGRGDMLFLPPGSSRLIRSQGAFVSDDEITNIVEYLKRNGPPVFAEEVQRQIDAGGDDQEGLEGGGEEDDELFQDAIEVLRTTKRASTSMLQRRLRIGYNRAARIMELMEQRGVVGPENGSSPREILVDLESL